MGRGPRARENLSGNPHLSGCLVGPRRLETNSRTMSLFHISTRSRVKHADCEMAGCLIGLVVVNKGCRPSNSTNKGATSEPRRPAYHQVAERKKYLATDPDEIGGCSCSHAADTRYSTATQRPLSPRHQTKRLPLQQSRLPSLDNVLALCCHQKRRWSQLALALNDHEQQHQNKGCRHGQKNDPKPFAIFGARRAFARVKIRTHAVVGR